MAMTVTQTTTQASTRTIRGYPEKGLTLRLRSGAAFDSEDGPMPQTRLSSSAMCGGRPMASYS